MLEIRYSRQFRNLDQRIKSVIESCATHDIASAMFGYLTIINQFGKPKRAEIWERFCKQCPTRMQDDMKRLRAAYELVALTI